MIQNSNRIHQIGPVGILVVRNQPFTNQLVTQPVRRRSDEPNSTHQQHEHRQHGPPPPTSDPLASGDPSYLRGFGPLRNIGMGRGAQPPGFRDVQGARRTNGEPTGCHSCTRRHCYATLHANSSTHIPLALNVDLLGSGLISRLAPSPSTCTWSFGTQLGFRYTTQVMTVTARSTVTLHRSVEVGRLMTESFAKTVELPPPSRLIA
eukprot:COSAG02_NODE_1916_length_10389_cov_4.419922_11_plen_206_part_00